jgi:opacity protein-like surface antigen
MMVRTALAAALLMTIAGAARADDRPGASVAGSVSAMNAASDTSLSFGAAFAYKFNRVVGLEVEATVVPDLESGDDFDDRGVIRGQAAASAIQGSTSALGLLAFPAPTFRNAGGRQVFFTNSVRVDIPTTLTRIAPYFAAGGGVAHTRTGFDYTYSYSALPIVPTGGTPFDLSRLLPPPRPITQRITTSATELVLTLGGGVGFELTQHVSLDADLRLFRLFGQTDRNAGRFGVGARYRF